VFPEMKKALSGFACLSANFRHRIDRNCWCEKGGPKGKRGAQIRRPLPEFGHLVPMLVMAAHTPRTRGLCWGHLHWVAFSAPCIRNAGLTAFVLFTDNGCGTQKGNVSR